MYVLVRNTIHAVACLANMHKKSMFAKRGALSKIVSRHTGPFILGRAYHLAGTYHY